MNLTNLILNACNENKLEELEVIKMLASEIQEEDTGELYEKFYKKAYGETVSKELAESTVMNMSVTDGSERVNGQKWTIDQTTNVGTEIGVDWSKIPKCNFYVVMNMCYSDYINTARKVEYDEDPKFFAYLAKDWLCDTDAPSDKLFRYIFRVLS